MEFRHLGRSGLQVSAIAYGNWITHGSQVEEDQASACVRAALDLGITTFDTADVYAGTRAESVLGRVQQLRPIAEDLGLSMAQLAIAWVLQNRNVAAAIIGASRPEQVHDNVRAAGVHLDDEVLKRIDDALGDVVERDPGKTQRG